MIASLLPALLLLAAPQNPPAAPEWEDPAVFAVGTERPRATFVALRDARGGDRARPRALAVLPAAERRLALPLGEEPVRPAGGLRAAGLRRRGLGHDAGAVELAGGGREREPALRPAVLLEHQAPVQGRPAARPARRQPRRALPHALRGAGRVEGPERLRALRGRAVGLLRVAERAEAGLQGGRVHAGRVRPDGAPAAGDERARGRGDPPLGRQLPRGPGLLALRRDLPRRVPARAAEGAPARLRGAHRPRRRLPRRDARAPRVAREPLGGARPRATRWSRRCWRRTAARSSGRRSRRRARSPPAARPCSRPRASCARPASGRPRRRTSTRSCSSTSTGPGRCRRSSRRGSASARSRSRAGSCC